MATDKELLDMLKWHGECLDRNSQAHYLNWMTTEKLQEDKTAVATRFGSYGFNPTASALVLAQWRQVVPRNNRRKRIVFTATNQQLYFSNNETQVGISDLINWTANGFNGEIGAMLITFGSGGVFTIESTEPIYVASITAGGSTQEQKAIVSWVEDIYADSSANPLGQRTTNSHHEAGKQQHLPSSSQAQRIAGNATAGYTHDGVR